MTAEHGIELTGLEKSYGSSSGPVRAIRGIDIAVARGETVALLGPNGAGKSTTIDMLLGLQAPDRGTVAVFGDSPAQAIKRGRIGAMLQTGGLLRDLSVRELVAMMAALYPTPLQVGETLELARVADLGERRTDKLSGGQTQRVRFAIALISNPDLLVCSDSDAAIRALLAAEPQARDIEIAGAGLEEAFLQLTGDADEDGEERAT